MHTKQLAINLFLTSIVVLIVTGFMAYDRYGRAFKESYTIIESYQTIRAANQALISLNEAALEVSTFLFSKDTEALRKLPENIISAQVNMDALYQLTRDDVVEIELFKKLKPLFDEKIKFLRKIVYEYSSGNQALALEIASDKSRAELMSKITQLIIDIKKMEVGQKDQSVADYNLSKIEADKFFIFITILDVLLFLSSFILVRRLLV